MKGSITCMQRMEKKYLLNESAYHQLMEYLLPYVKEDEYHKSTICNLYYDTKRFDLIQHSLQKPVYKEKLRLRSYGIPNDNAMVYLEIKKKCQGVVNKRRIVLPYASFEQRDQIQDAPNAKQIEKEISYMLHFYDVEPRVFIAYDRRAYVGRDNASLRITFDVHIRSRMEHLRLDYGDQGEKLLPKGSCLMEIKVPSAYPLWLARLLSALQIYPVSFSKYGRVYQKSMIERSSSICLQAS